MSVLSGIEPKDVFKYFEEICAIPHGSGNTKQISDYCVNFAKKHGLKYIQDESNNVIIFKDGTQLPLCCRVTLIWCAKKAPTVT